MAAVSAPGSRASLARNPATHSPEGPAPITASALAAAALHVFGATVNIEQAAKIVYKNRGPRGKIDTFSPIFLPETLPMYGNALLPRLRRYHFPGLDTLRNEAAAWLATSL